MNDTRLLGYLAERFTHSVEDIATESLAFLLARSPTLRAAFGRALVEAIPAVQAPTSFRTQVSQPIDLATPSPLPDDLPMVRGQTRPDMVGFDEHGIERVLIESKFWAGLTTNQPAEYLKRLARNEDWIAAAVVVLAPARRLDSLWRELGEACEQEAPIR